MEKKQNYFKQKNRTPPIKKKLPHAVPKTQLAKMSVDPKFIELTADVLKIFFFLITLTKHNLLQLLLVSRVSGIHSIYIHTCIHTYIHTYACDGGGGAPFVFLRLIASEALSTCMYVSHKFSLRGNVSGRLSSWSEKLLHTYGSQSDNLTSECPCFRTRYNRYHRSIVDMIAHR